MRPETHVSETETLKILLETRRLKFEMRSRRDIASSETLAKIWKTLKTLRL